MCATTWARNIHPRAPRFRTWRGSAWRPDGSGWVVTSARPSLHEPGVVPTTPESPRVADVRATPRGKALDWFMAAPVWTLRPDGTVEVYDLRFVSVVLPRGKTFRVEFPSGSLDPIVH